MTFERGVRLDPGRASRGSGGRGRTGVAVGGGLGGIGLIIVILVQLLGGNPGDLGVGATPQEGTSTEQGEAFAQCTTGEAANTDTECRMIATAESLDAVWAELLPAQGVEYVQPGLVLFDTESVSTGCGEATAAVGPFYCPADQTAYTDVAFFQVLADQYGASTGPLAQEYVMAHEFGHHIQNQLGQLGQGQQGVTGEQSAAVRSELQADCYAGIWVARASTSVDPDTGSTFLVPPTQADIADALSAASAVGDDRIQAQAGRVDPETWTHGSSEQRQRWFTTGYESADVAACDTSTGEV